MQDDTHLKYRYTLMSGAPRQNQSYTHRSIYSGEAEAQCVGVTSLGSLNKQFALDSSHLILPFAFENTIL